MDTPTFTKREPRPYDYQEMTWAKFLRLREWAKQAAQEIGHPIYLVGSVLTKEVPRDFDVVITIPADEYEQKYGKLTEENWPQIIRNAWHDHVKHYFDCEETLGGYGNVALDLKVYPDNWFTDKDKLLLGQPNKI
jgi:hypothetical protein